MKKLVLSIIFLNLMLAASYAEGKTMKIVIDSTKATNLESMKWRGMGMVSGNNSSRLLLDYKAQNPEAYNELLQLMFGKEGIGIQHLKIEMGADINSSSGTEPCTLRAGETKADVTRGAGFILCADAKKINPDITLDMLWWGEPMWIENAEDKYAARYSWYKANLCEAYNTFGIKFDYVSCTQNERGWDYNWIKYLSKSLKNETDCPYDFSKIKIVAGDEVCSWNQAKDMFNDEELMKAIDVVGSHYTSWSISAVKMLQEEGKEVWFSEGSSPMGYSKGIARYDGNGSGLSGLNNVLDVANRIITMYPCGRMTLYEFQPVVSAYYDGVSYCHKQLITANTPWSGYYELDPGFFMTLHFSQFIKRGWSMIDVSCYGDGKKAGDGHAIGDAVYSYLTGCNKESGDWSTVITNTTNEDITYEFLLKDKSKNLPVYVYETSSYKTEDTLKKSQVNVIGDKAQVIIKPNSIITVSSLDINSKELVDNFISQQNKRKNSILSLPYKDDFNYLDKKTGFVEKRGGAPLYTTDEGGAFEIIKQENQKYCLRQQINNTNRGKEWGGTPEPVTNFGDDRWYNYSVSIDIKFAENLTKEEISENYAGIGLRYNLPESGKNGYWLKLRSDGKWNFMRDNKIVWGGKLSNFDILSWNKIKLCAENNTFTGYFNDEELFKIKIEEYDLINQGAGRAAIYSAYQQNCYKDLLIEPIGETPYVDRFDNLDTCFTYIENNNSKWEQKLMDSFKQYKRTASKGKKDSEVQFDFSGTGFNLTGNCENSCSFEIKIDGKKLKEAEINKVGNRQALYSISGLKDKKHKVELKIKGGEMNIDALEVLRSN